MDVVFIKKGDLSLVGPALVAAAVEGLEDAAIIYAQTLNETIHNIGAGHPYPSRKGDGSIHWASAPGDPISEDTGETQSEIKIFRDEMPVCIKIGFEGQKAEDMARLEMGDPTTHLEPRPTMPVAYSTARESILEAIAAAVKGTLLAAEVKR